MSHLDLDHKIIEAYQFSFSLYLQDLPSSFDYYSSTFGTFYGVSVAKLTIEIDHDDKEQGNLNF